MASWLTKFGSSSSKKFPARSQTICGSAPAPRCTLNTLQSSTAPCSTTARNDSANNLNSCMTAAHAVSLRRRWSASLNTQCKPSLADSSGGPRSLKAHSVRTSRRASMPASATAGDVSVQSISSHIKSAIVASKRDCWDRRGEFSMTCSASIASRTTPCGSGMIATSSAASMRVAMCSRCAV